jgi:hypothetical protein
MALGSVEYQLARARLLITWYRAVADIARTHSLRPLLINRILEHGQQMMGWQQVADASNLLGDGLGYVVDLRKTYKETLAKALPIEGQTAYNLNALIDFKIDQYAKMTEEIIKWVDGETAGKSGEAQILENIAGQEIPDSALAKAVEAGQRYGITAMRDKLLGTGIYTRPELVKLVNVAEYEVRRFERDAVGEIHAASQQAMLANPAVSSGFQFALYLTRDDQRVRPTHAAMQNFYAHRSWEGWPRARPLNGWNCRCDLRMVNNVEAMRRGWMNKDRTVPKSQIVHWPNTAAENNWRENRFPDKGFFGPKTWSFAALSIDYSK